MHFLFLFILFSFLVCKNAYTKCEFLFFFPQELFDRIFLCFFRKLKKKSSGEQVREKNYKN